MKKLAILVFALSVLGSVRGGDETRAALVNELTQLSGVDELVRDAKKAMNQQADQATEQMFNQIRSGMPGLTKKTWDAIQAAADKMVQKVQSSWSVDEAVQTWQAEFTRDFTDAELREVLAASKTPLGRKQIAASKRASAGLQKFLGDRAKTAMDAAVQEYVTELQQIIADATATPKSDEAVRP